MNIFRTNSLNRLYPIHKFSLLIVLIMAGLTLLSNVELAESASWILDRFESSIRVVQPNETGPNKYLWNLYSGAGSGPTSVTTADRYEGNQSLHNQFTGGSNWQFQFYTYTYALPGWSNGWQFVRKFVTNPSTWQTGKVNRMRFWIKLPPGLTTSTSGGHNFDLGTYIRCSTCGGAEDGGGHFYHFFDFASTGQWEQVIVDTHPDHNRGYSGNIEHSDKLHPTNEPGFTYFDLMTRFYLDFPYETFTLPADFYIDGFELYQETMPENVDQIRSLHAVYIPTTNEVRVGWTRRKDEDTIKHEVRYAFNDIFSTGWANATPAPDGTITPRGSGGYNSMLWSTTALNLSGESLLYVAIKPQNSNSYRQIAIPVSSGGNPAPPFAAPTELKVVQP